MSTTDAEAFEGKTLKDLATWKLPDRQITQSKFFTCRLQLATEEKYSSHW